MRSLSVLFQFHQFLVTQLKKLSKILFEFDNVVLH